MFSHKILLLVFLATSGAVAQNPNPDWYHLGICDRGAALYESCEDGVGFCYYPGTNSASKRGIFHCFLAPCSFCGDLPKPENGYFVQADAFTAELHCCDGFTATGTTYITCMNMTWSQSNYSCAPVECGIPTALNGSFETFPGTAYPSFGLLICDPGFTLNPSSFEDTVILCTQDGNWTEANASCDPLNCDDPNVTAPAHGSIVSQTGYEIVFECDGIYELIGDDVMTCTADGSWIGSPPICALDCPSIGDPAVFEGTTYYKYEDTFLSRDDATAQCAAYGQKLFTVESYSEYEYVLASACRLHTVTHNYVDAGLVVNDYNSFMT